MRASKRSEAAPARRQFSTLPVAYPGKYQIACGKGYWECEGGELPDLELELPAIDYHLFENANSLVLVGLPRK
jgi:hypothetical protein